MLAEMAGRFELSFSTEEVHIFHAYNGNGVCVTKWVYNNGEIRYAITDNGKVIIEFEEKY